MNLKMKVIAGAMALALGASLALPTRARADSDDWHREHRAWQWHHHDRDDEYRDGYRHDRDGDRPGYQGRYVPPNGEGMISRRNPNFYWACDSDGHHCHWARR